MEEKKKRKINIIDIIVILVILAAIAVVGVKLAGDKVQDAVSSKVNCYAEVEIYDVKSSIEEEVKRQGLVGERIVSGNSYMNASVEKVWFEAQNPADDLKPEMNKMVVLIKTKVAEGTASPAVGSQELRAGKDYIVKTQTFEMTGTVRYVELGNYTK